LGVEEFFWGVTLPLIITFIGMFASLIVMYLLERRKLDKIPEIADGVRDVSREVEGLRELTNYFRNLRAVYLDPIIEEIMKYGFEGYLRNVLGLKMRGGANPLTSEEKELRKRLIEKGRKVGLSREEARRLREILDKEVREAFAEGIIGFLGLLALLFLIGLLVAYLTRGEGSNQA